MELGLRNKVALVTASSQGLGKASAMALAREGAKVVLCSRNEKAIHQTAEEVRSKTGASVLPVVADVSKALDIIRLVNAAVKEFGTIHVLVNNAGGPPTGHILSLSDGNGERGSS